MRTLYLDCFSGISGDMTVAALLDLGLNLETITPYLERLPIHGYHVHSARDRDGALSGMRFLIDIDPEQAERSDRGHQHHHGPPDGHLEAHEHGTGHEHRTWRDIARMLETSDLPEQVRRNAMRIFERLAQAESRVHGIPIEDVAFHEVGAVDSIVDIVSVAVGLYLLEVDEVQCSPLPLGQGEVTCQHGTLPLPAPATLELLRGIPLRGAARDVELVTPTGAAIVSAMARRFGPLPAMVPERIGYGLGQRRGGQTPNALRAVLGQTPSEPGSLPLETVQVLEADIDDMNPQFYQPLMDRLFEAGALDVTLSPLVMKKGRPGTLVRVVCPPSLHQRVTEILLEESTTLGVRYHSMERACLERSIQTIETRYGPVRVKLGTMAERTVNLMPEFEDCRKASLEHGVSVKTVHQEAIRQALNLSVAQATPTRSTDDPQGEFGQ